MAPRICQNCQEEMINSKDLLVTCEACGEMGCTYCTEPTEEGYVHFETCLEEKAEEAKYQTAKFR